MTERLGEWVTAQYSKCIKMTLGTYSLTFRSDGDGQCKCVCVFVCSLTQTQTETHPSLHLFLVTASIGTYFQWNHWSLLPVSSPPYRVTPPPSSVRPGCSPGNTVAHKSFIFERNAQVVVMKQIQQEASIAKEESLNIFQKEKKAISL